MLCYTPDNHNTLYLQEMHTHEIMTPSPALQSHMTPCSYYTVT